MKDTRGLLVCAKYASAPNYFGFCGPRQSPALTDHLEAAAADDEVTAILSEFETLYPYLQLIARSNRIAQPFRRDVVEAYWLGNDLLHQVSARDTWALWREKLSIEKVLEPERLLKTKQKLFTLKYLPHHAFHVFNIFKRTGKAMGVHSLETMDACRIGWGKVTRVLPTENKSDGTLLVETQPLAVSAQDIFLGPVAVRRIHNGYRGKTFLSGLSSGDWVSFHWGFACDRLSGVQVKHLAHYTQKAIAYYNNKWA